MMLSSMYLVLHTIRARNLQGHGFRRKAWKQHTHPQQLGVFFSSALTCVLVPLTRNTVAAHPFVSSCNGDLLLFLRHSELPSKQDAAPRVQFLFLPGTLGATRNPNLGLEAVRPTRRDTHFGRRRIPTVSGALGGYKPCVSIDHGEERTA